MYAVGGVLVKDGSAKMCCFSNFAQAQSLAEAEVWALKLFIQCAIEEVNCVECKHHILSFLLIKIRKQ